MLYIVSTPIGNPDDITRRALRVLREAHAIICEERREGARLLHAYQIENEIVDLNEHNERVRAPELLERLQRGENLALISDHGTPLLADPGGRLVERAIAANIPVSAVPGASSLLAALVVSGLPMARFRFVGLLPAKKEARRRALQALRRERDTLMLMDAPYRLLPLLEDLAAILGAARRIAVACDLTMPGEFVERGAVGEVLARFRERKWKGEFVVVVGAKRMYERKENHQWH